MGSSVGSTYVRTRERRRRAPRWYVARVHEGREDHAARTCRRLIGEDILADCFVPKVQLLKKSEGSWGAVEPRTLYPGYLFLATDAPEDLDAATGDLALRIRLLGDQGCSHIPLAEQEQEWFEWALDEAHVLRPSEGYIEDGITHVTAGPLRGCEERIRKIDRHKRLAMVQINMPDRSVQAKAALEIKEKTTSSKGET